MTFSDVIYKYFRGDRTMYFHSSDALTQIEGSDTYLKYVWRPDGRIELYFGGNNGDVCIKVCSNAEQLDALIRAIIR